MTEYEFFLELTIKVESPRTPQQIRNALLADPSFKQGFKQFFRDQLAKDPSGQTVVIDWEADTLMCTKLDDDTDIDYDEENWEEL